MSPCDRFVDFEFHRSYNRCMHPEGDNGEPLFNKWVSAGIYIVVILYIFLFVISSAKTITYEPWLDRAEPIVQYYTRLVEHGQPLYDIKHSMDYHLRCF
jgi:hypothetical protein